MQLPIYQVDAFSDKVFGGNPAAVCPLEDWIDDKKMQSIASENNLAETAFFVQGPESIHLRWFTPKFEIDLCGHATLAAAHVLFEQLAYSGDTLNFETRSGRLTVQRKTNLLSMDFPSRPPVAMTPPATLKQALGTDFGYVGKSRDILVEVASEQIVQNLKPDMGLIEQLNCIGVIVTANSERIDLDFVSRFFAPQAGVPEDPVTGSAHSTLIPYWGEKLNKKKLSAMQISPRGGYLLTEWQGDRVEISGRAITYMIGNIFV